MKTLIACYTPKPTNNYEDRFTEFSQSNPKLNMYANSHIFIY